MEEVVCRLIEVYIFVIIIRLFMSWVPPRGPGTYATIHEGFVTVTEPVLAPVRSLIPPLRTGAMALDLSPLLVIVGLNLLASLICEGLGLF